MPPGENESLQMQTFSANVESYSRSVRGLTPMSTIHRAVRYAVSGVGSPATARTTMVVGIRQ